MTLQPGTRLGPYEISSPLGAGGMGEVYSARDTRLGRKVAIKILPAEFASDAQFRMRLEREAKTISSLNHPNICTLYDIGHENGSDYLVMELLEGETLADRLSRGPLQTDEVLRYGIEIAEALNKAHRQGIVHRDLKPGNVMLTKNGAKLLDFGLAKSAASVVDLAGTTQQRPLTQEGTIVGTFQYMAPEQLEGVEADARTDIFALGAVLYEMATGKRAFEGKTKTSLIAAIVSGRPTPVSQLRPLTPRTLEHVIERCLEKDPLDRWQSAHDVAAELRWTGKAPEAVARPRDSRLLWLILLIAVVATAVITWRIFELRREPPSVVQSSILPPEKMQFAFDAAGSPAISPDGKSIVFAAQPSGGGPHILYVRPLNSKIAQPLAGTENARFPFWSPDSRSIAFFANRKLNRMDLSGGAAQVICDAPEPRGGSWSRDGVIVFAPAAFGPLFKVSDGGGAPAAVTKLDVADGETDHRWPAFLPDGRRFVYLSRRFAARAEDPTPVNFGGTIEIGSTDGGLKKTLFASNSNAVYSRSGHLLYWRDRSLVAQQFNPRTLTMGADIVPIAERVLRTGRWDAAFSISDSGALAYEVDANRDLTQLTWFDANGKPLGVLGTPAEYAFPRFSHDGRHLALAIADSATGRTDLWIQDLAREASTRLTFDPHDEWTPIWSPDDSRIVYGSDAKGSGDIMMKRSSGTGAEEVVYANRSFKVATDWSPDGKMILFQQENTSGGTDWDIYLYSLEEHKAVPFLQTPFAEIGGSFSPDGRWVLYFSIESGKPEVYVQPLSRSGAKWQISTNGGSRPRWSRDGKRIYYVSLDGKLMAVDVSAAGDDFRANVPRVVLQANMKRYVGSPFDVSPDGRILVTVSMNQGELVPLTLVQNWTAALKK
jgi:serine/threonine protein kinase